MLNRCLKYFFENKYTKVVIAYLCLTTSLIHVFASVMYLLYSVGITDLDIGYIPFSGLIGIGTLHLIPYGFLLYKFKFCAWSIYSWLIIVVYSVAGDIFEIFNIPFTLLLKIALNSVLLILVIFVIINLLKVRFKCCKN